MNKGFLGMRPVLICPERLAQVLSQYGVYITWARQEGALLVGEGALPLP